MRSLFLALFLAILAWQLPARAESLPDLTRFIEQEIDSMNTAVAETQAEGADDSNYFFKQFMVRVQGIVGINVAWAAKFQVVPEVELVWMRNTPALQ